ncbi:hypothetical protein Chor_006233 [Crotalus horridus]
MYTYQITNELMIQTGILSKQSSESEDEQYEEEWVPKKEVSRKAKVPKPKVPRVEKKALTKKKTTVAKKGTKKLVIKEEPDLSLPIAVPGGTEKMTEEDVNVSCSTKKLPVKKVGSIKGEPGSVNADKPSTSSTVSKRKIKMEEDFTFGEPPLKKKKKGCPQEKCVKYAAVGKLNGDHKMNWDIVQILSQRTDIEEWVCANIVKLFNDDNTIPFIVRYRKELINNLEADVLREVQQIMEELHKGTKAQRAKQLGLEQAANLLLENPKELNLFFYVKPNVEGLSTNEEVKSGVQHILADMIAKDKETLDFIRNL